MVDAQAEGVGDHRDGVDRVAVLRWAVGAAWAAVAVAVGDPSRVAAGSARASAVAGGALAADAPVLVAALQRTSFSAAGASGRLHAGGALGSQRADKPFDAAWAFRPAGGQHLRVSYEELGDLSLDGPLPQGRGDHLGDDGRVEVGLDVPNDLDDDGVRLYQRTRTIHDGRGLLRVGVIRARLGRKASTPASVPPLAAAALRRGLAAAMGSMRSSMVQSRMSSSANRVFMLSRSGFSVTSR
jgi:hypothetical protein